MINAYPLQWPPGWPRTTQHRPSKFGTYTFEQMRREVLRELKLLRATDIVISSNLRLRQDGYPYSGQRQPDDVGLAVYFKLNGEDQCIPCDKWNRIEDNLRAIVKTIEALRGLERWGAKEMVNAAFRGFKALPAQAIVTPFTAKPWHEVLEVAPTASAETVKAAYRSLLLRHHPDQGGDEARFHDVQRAWGEYQSGGHHA